MVYGMKPAAALNCSVEEAMCGSTLYPQEYLHGIPLFAYYSPRPRDSGFLSIAENALAISTRSSTPADSSRLIEGAIS